MKVKFLGFGLDNYKGYWYIYTISKARQSKMSENRAAGRAILDKFEQILVVLYQRCLKKMSENAERPARSRPRIGSEGAADRLERVVPGRRSGQKERPTASSVLFPAADQVRRSGRPPRACCSRPRIRSEGAADLIERVVPGRGSGQKERPTTSSVLFPDADRVRRSGRPHRACCSRPRNKTKRGTDRCPPCIPWSVVMPRSLREHVVLDHAHHAVVERLHLILGVGRLLMVAADAGIVG